MIMVLVMVLCGGLLVVGAICLIVAFSGTSGKTIKTKGEGQSLGKETMAMAKFSRKKFDLTTLPDGKTVPVPKQFDAHFIMEQLAEIQQSPNVVSAYVNDLLGRFHTNRQISFIKKMEEFYVALASGMEAQLNLMDLQDEFENMQDIENQALKKKIFRGKLKRDLAKVEAEQSRFRNVGDQQENQRKRSDPYSKAKTQVERKIAYKRGRKDGIDELKREMEDRIYRVLRGKNEKDANSFQKEEIMEIRRYYEEILDEL